MIVLAVDPGREKCGLAIVSSENGVLFRCITSRDQVSKTVLELMSRYSPDCIISGGGTGSRQLMIELKPVCEDITLVDEQFTTLDARQRYFQENPPRGLFRLIPRGLLSPKVPIDDYAAVILAEQYIASFEENEHSSRSS